ncbi:hypothetical protein [Clostridium baratii]|uniref:hypothetical protein n=1 Tax=Clostridium baratii TaxID=1561 RepID=UPI0030D5A826
MKITCRNCDGEMETLEIKKFEINQGMDEGFEAKATELDNHTFLLFGERLGTVEIEESINKEKLLTFMCCTSILLSHIEDVANTVIEDGYADVEELKDDMNYVLKRLKVVRNKEKYIKEVLEID